MARSRTSAPGPKAAFVRVPCQSQEGQRPNAPSRTARIARRTVAPFATPPSRPNLTAKGQSATRGKHERSRWRYPDRKEPQTAGHRSPVRGRRISDHRDRRGRAEGRRRLSRHAQRAECRLRGGGLRLSHRPSRRLRHRYRPRRGARPLGSRQCPAELLAHDPDRRRLGDPSRRHGCVPGRAPGADRLAVLQVRARHRERAAHSLLCRDGDPERDLRSPRRHLSRHARRHHPGQVRARQDRRGRRACPNRRARWPRRRTSRRR